MIQGRFDDLDYDAPGYVSYYLGIIHYKQERYDDAVAAFKNALADPKFGKLESAAASSETVMYGGSEAATRGRSIDSFGAHKAVLSYERRRYNDAKEVFCREVLEVSPGGTQLARPDHIEPLISAVGNALGLD